MKRQHSLAVCLFLALLGLAQECHALDGGVLRFTPRSGWRALEVISVGDNPAGDGSAWQMPLTFDGVGAWRPDPGTLRLSINHENVDATISEVNLHLAGFQAALRNTIATGAPGGVSFVTSARQAYERWSGDGGATWNATSDPSTTTFYRFCSGQAFAPHAFGFNRGFIDNLYLTGEEGSTNRLFALDLTTRDFYQLSGVTGAAPGGVGGMPFDAFENVALLDTGETDHVALVLSPDGGSQTLQLYIGEKGKDQTGAPSNSLLARNGLAYGSTYYFNGALPASPTPLSGTFDATPAGALTAGKLEDVDANPNDPQQFMLGNQIFGAYRFDVALDFNGGGFHAATSGFSVTRVQAPVAGVDGAFGDADNLDWTKATTLNGVNYPDGLIFVNEDSATANGETWVMRPDGSDLTLVGENIAFPAATETSGVLDISQLVGYRPGSVALVANQGGQTSLTALIHPFATLLADFNSDGAVNAADYVVWRDSQGDAGAGLPVDGDLSGQVDAADYDVWVEGFTGAPAGPASGPATGAAAPEPHTLALLLAPCLLAPVMRGHLRCASAVQREVLLSGR